MCSSGFKLNYLFALFFSPFPFCCCCCCCMKRSSFSFLFYKIFVYSFWCFYSRSSENLMNDEVSCDVLSKNVESVGYRSIDCKGYLNVSSYFKGFLLNFFGFFRCFFLRITYSGPISIPPEVNSSASPAI